MQKDDADVDIDDDDDDVDGDDDLLSDLMIDEEAALNTNVNMRVTRPSFSLSLLSTTTDNSIDMEQNRISSIRFRG